MPEKVVKHIMSKYKAKRKEAEKATAIAENTGNNPDSILHQIRAGYYSGKRKKRA